MGALCALILGLLVGFFVGRYYQKLVTTTKKVADIISHEFADAKADVKSKIHFP